jgi:prepilin-type N-terminal cleavage/methylation domain-containing protein
VKPSLSKYSSQSGFTLVEVIVVMAVFIVILMIAGESFNRIITQSSKLFKSEESNIEGIIGLEVMKHDLEQMGFGLPWGWSKADNSATPTDLVDSTITYAEAVDSLGLALNDAPSTVPRAFVSFAGFGNFTSDYIGVKASSVGSSKAAQRWTYIPFHNYSASPRESRPVSFASNNPTVGDRSILINSNYNDPGNKDHRLIVDVDDVTNFNINYNTTGGSIAGKYLPTDDQQTYMVYGVDSDTTLAKLRMPFNRADFFIGRNLSGNVVPPFCAERTGILYKATINHSDGGNTPIPLLDCVADMQVVLGWDTSDGGTAGSINAYSSLPKKSDGIVANVTTTDPAAATSVRAAINGWLIDAKGLREHLKIVKVYILAQEGKRDPVYTTPSSSISVGDITENSGLSPVKTYTLTEPQRHYRWKLYRIVVRPKNLVSNQR